MDYHTIRCDVITFAQFIRSSEAAFSLEMIFNDFKTGILQLQNDLWTTFMGQTRRLMVTGFISVDNLERMLPYVHVYALDCPRLQFQQVGRLRSLTPRFTSSLGSLQ